MKNITFGKIIPTVMIPVILILLLNIFGSCNGGTTSYNVIKTEQSVDIPLENLPPPPGYNAPEQVHITQGDHNGRAVIVSWVTQSEPGSKSVKYWKANGDDYKHKSEAHGHVKTYTYCNYTSGYIHHATIRNLEHDTKYFYEVGSGHVTRKFSFTTPPAVGPDVPYNFGIIGDLGQTYDSNQTLEHYISNPKGQTLLYLGDLSYADHYPLGDNRRWDSWGRFVEKSVAYQPWIWTAGNHELDFLPENGETVPFKPFMHRYHTPYKASKSTSPLWYSIKRASAYIIVLSSYSAIAYSEQWQWFYQELKKVNREETPWLIVLFHSPIYNSNAIHYMEAETMRLFFETLFVKSKVDIVLAGHVHAYERLERISKIGYNITNGLSPPVFDQSAPVYMTVGDGGNVEGHADKFIEPQPSYSAYREASFGHAMLEIKNQTHAYFAWYRNQDDEAVVGDSLWLHNRYWFPTKESSSATTKA